MRLLGDTRADRVLSLELVAFVLSLPVVVPAFAVWVLAHEARERLSRRFG